MRFEFFSNGTKVGSAWWEGPGRVGLDVGAQGDRDYLTRYFSTEDVFLTGGFDDAEPFQVQRPDSTRWGFERACWALADRYRVEPHPEWPAAGGGSGGRSAP